MDALRLATLQATRGGLDAGAAGVVLRDVEDHAYAAHIEAGPAVVAYMIIDTRLWCECMGYRPQADGRVEFPAATAGGLDVNMMPFLLADPETSLPTHIRQYAPLVRACPWAPTCEEDFTRVGYLTVKETVVHPGECQRRPGLHVERPGPGAAGGGRQYRAPDTGSWYYDPEDSDMK